MTCIARRNGRRNASFRTTATARRLLTTAVALASVLPALQAQAAPAGYRIEAGAGSIKQEGLTTTITQSKSQTQQPARMVINWNIFSSAAGESIVFNQPNAAAVALNRVTGASPSQLLGSLTANGQVFILNPNGVLFGPGSQVNVRGLLASTLGMDTAGFMAGTYALQGSSSARVVNQGTLKALDGGYIALVGPIVVNDNSISASKGDALLAAGDQVTLRLEGGGLLGYSMDLGSANALVANRGSGVISANGGRVVLEARAGAEALSKAVVNHAGLIEAQTLDNVKGSIKLIGDRKVGQLTVSGTLDASSPALGSSAGVIETSAAQVKIADSTKVTTKEAGGTPGTWQINANDFEIAADSGARTASSIGATTLANALQNLNVANSNVTIATSPTGAGTGHGDITVNADVAWQGFGKLTLQAHRNIIFNASLGGASVSLLYGQASPNGDGADFYFNNGAKIFLNSDSATFSTQKGSSAANVKNYTIVRSLGTEGTADPSTLQGVSSPADARTNYALGADINAATTAKWSSGKGFSPLPSLKGTFEGLGHEISGLTIKRPDSSTDNSIFGLFTRIESGAVVHNLNITKADINGVDRVAILAGINLGTIQNLYVTGKVVGTLRTGGLVGANSGTISSSHSDATVEGRRIAGGLVGENSVGVISDSYASGAVSAGDKGGEFNSEGPGYAGGLVGFNRARITGSYSNGTATGTVAVGGLVGGNMGIIDNSYANGSVNGNTWVGGLVGEAREGSNIKNTYAAGAVTGTASVGGLVGKAKTNTLITNTYATGAVNGKDSATTHGLVGETADGLVSNSYWNIDSVAAGGTGQKAPGAGVEQTGAQLQQVATFSDWDIAATGGTDKVWRIYEGNSKPLLRSLLAPLVLETVRSEYSAAKQYGPAIPSVNNRAGVAASGRDAGTYLPYSTSQQGYDISNGELVITPHLLTLTASAPGKVYDGNRQASVTLDATPLSTDVVTVAYTTAAFDNKNVGNEKIITVSGITLGAKDAGNYTFTPPPTTTASITPRPLDITASAADKTYDGTSQTSATLADNRLAGDAVTASYQRADFADKNGGQQKTVTVSGIALAGADALNYQANTSTTTSASIKPIGLTITANSDTRLADGVPYRGGNGVTYAGFIPGETAAVLAGQLRYSGDAQGAMQEGVYRITPGGLTSLNYASTFVDGALTIQPLPPGAGIVAAYTEPGMPAPLAYVGRNTGAGTLRVLDCGMRLPENLLVGGCQPAAQSGNPGQ